MCAVDVQNYEFMMERAACLCIFHVTGGISFSAHQIYWPSALYSGEICVCKNKMYSISVAATMTSAFSKAAYKCHDCVHAVIFKNLLSHPI